MGPGTSPVAPTDNSDAQGPAEGWTTPPHHLGKMPGASDGGPPLWVLRGSGRYPRYFHRTPWASPCGIMSSRPWSSSVWGGAGKRA